MRDFDVSVLDNVPEQDLLEIYQSIREGAKTPAESLGFEAPALNAVEQMALAYYRAKRWGQAATIYGFLLHMDSGRATAWRGLGACAHAQKQWGIAAAALTQAVERAPGDIIAKVLLGESLCQNGDKKLGLEQLKAAIAAGSKEQLGAAYVARARAIVSAGGGIPSPLVLRKQGQDVAREAEAMAEAELAGPLTYDEGRDIELEDMKKNPKLLAQIKELSAAVQDGRLTLAEVGGFTENELHGAYACACKYADMGQVLQAIQIAGYLIFLNPHDGRYFQLIGICMQRLGQYDGADYFYRTALVLLKDDPMTTIYLGESRIMAGKVDDGVQLVKKGLGLAEKSPAQHKDLIDRAHVLVRQFGRN
jgi:tetratricopeptide (TPR) repeat protein